MSFRTFQRGIAAATIAAIALAIAPVQAADVSGSIQLNTSATYNTANTAVTSIAFTPSANITAGQTVSITLTGFQSGSFVTADVTDTADIEDIAVAAGVITFEATNTLTSGVEVDLTIANGNLLTPVAPATASIAVSTSTNDNGVQLFYFGGDNQVTVSATVQPTLTLNLDTTAVNFGNLTTTPTPQNISIDYASNAAGGVAIAMASTGLTSATHEIGATDINGARTNVASTKYRVSTNGAADFLGGTEGAISSTDGADIDATQTVITASGSPVAVDNAIVRVGAAITALTPAGTYSDTLTFTATGSF